MDKYNYDYTLKYRNSYCTRNFYHVLYENVSTFKQAYRGYALGRPQCYGWFTQFKSGRQSIQHDTEPQPIYIEKIKDLVRANRRLTIRVSAEEVQISIRSCHDILSKKLN